MNVIHDSGHVDTLSLKITLLLKSGYKKKG